MAGYARTPHAARIQWFIGCVPLWRRGGYFHLVIAQAASHAGNDQRPHQTSAVAHPYRKVRDAPALVLVNLISVCWLPGTGNRPQTVRSRADNRFH
jgi:hypothetical protein